MQRWVDAAPQTDRLFQQGNGIATCDRQPRENRSLTFTCRSEKALKLRPKGYKAATQVKEGEPEVLRLGTLYTQA